MRQTSLHSETLDEMEAWNREDASELEHTTRPDEYDILVSARDWTVETVVQQVRLGNIDLDPAFQRRNAWRDQRRSRLIESFILGFPVPQIVLAENPKKKRSYVVIDGKQRLMTIAGFFMEEFRGYWTQPRFSGLSVLKDLNKVDISAFLEDPRYSSERRQLSNADIRTTVITGFKDEGVLYDIFYRINTGSVPLSSQELRQVLNRGPFAKYLLEATSQPNHLWTVLGIDQPDPRLRDVELLLRLVAWTRYSKIYTGNMKPFLDDTMKRLNQSWTKERKPTVSQVDEILSGVEAAQTIFGEFVGRKYKDDRFETSLNRVLFEVQVLHLTQPAIREAAIRSKRRVVNAFKELSTDPSFLASIEATTKSIENYRTRFTKYHDMLVRATDADVPQITLPFGKSKK